MEPDEIPQNMEEFITPSTIEPEPHCHEHSFHALAISPISRRLMPASSSTTEVLAGSDGSVADDNPVT